MELTEEKGRRSGSAGPAPRADTACGIGTCRPHCIQRCAHLLPFSFIFGIQTLITNSLSFYLSSQITTIEKQFGISSTDSGLILAGNDIGFLLSVLFVSYLGHRVHIPRVLTICGFLFGLSGLLCSLPHFIFDGRSSIDEARKSDNERSDHFLCRADNLTMGLNCDQTESQHYVSQSGWVVLYITLCYVIQGVAKSPRSPLGSVYLDSSTDKSKTGLYLAISTSFGIFGPFVALILGGVFGKIPVNLKPTTMTPEDPRWIGAWWLGFLLFGSLALVVSILVLMFPRTIPEPKSDGDESNETDDSSNRKSAPNDDFSVMEMLKAFPRVFQRLWKSKVYCLMVASNSFTLFGTIGLNSFGPKYMENIFNIPPWKANSILGVQVLVAGSLGTFLGGFLVSRLKLARNNCVKMILILCGVSTVCQFVTVFLGCENHSVKKSPMAFPGSTCRCEDSDSLMVCSTEGVTFFSPCHAGCTNVTDNVYSGCQATEGPMLPGICDSGCPFLIPYLIVTTINILSATLRLVPLFNVLLRSLEDQDRSIGMGLHSFIMSLIVFLPAPIAYGKLFDNTCLTWKETCGSKGACHLYDIESMRFTLMSVNALLAAISFLITIPAFIFSQKEMRESKMEQSIEITEPQTKTSPTSTSLTLPEK
ncbi:solute carrier organic anion transporter family member 2B1-like isoform X2 [Crassostrea virginica]